MLNTAVKTTSRRAALRNLTEAAVICRPYDSNGAFPVSDGVMRNFSTDGFYIETTKKFDAGAILIVRTLGYPIIDTSVEDQERPRTICLAEVRWRQELSDQYSTRYGMGLRYLA